MVYPGVIISGFVGVLLMNINIFTVFCWSIVNNYYIHFNLRRGTSAASFSASSLANSLISSLASSSVSSSTSSSVNSLANSLISLSYRYSFTVIVLKLVGPLISYTLYISPSILSNLYRPVHLLLCPVLPLHYISTFKLRGRLWIIVTDRPFC